MGLLALGSPLFAEPAALWGPTTAASERRLLKVSLATAMATAMATDSSRFLHPLVTLLGLAAARSAASSQLQVRPTALLSWDALRGSSLGRSIWMVRDRRFVLQGIRSGLEAPYSSLLRC
jgi:hypothetical protein